mgnify:CR=1 FL=1
MKTVLVRYINLPSTVNAATVIDEDGNYNVYINIKLSYYEQSRALKHEVYHIRHDHLDGEKSLEICEQEAGDYAKPQWR